MSSTSQLMKGYLQQTLFRRDMIATNHFGSFKPNLSYCGAPPVDAAIFRRFGVSLSSGERSSAGLLFEVWLDATLSPVCEGGNVVILGELTDMEELRGACAAFVVVRKFSC